MEAKDYKRTRITSPGEARESRGRDPWQRPEALELVSKKLNSIRKSHFPAMLLPRAQVFATASVSRWKAPKGRK